MTRLTRLIDAGNWRSGQHQIANRIEQFVANKLIIAAQAFRVDDIIAINHHGIVERASACEPHRFQRFHILCKTECPREGNIAREKTWRQAHRHLLRPDGFGLEFDFRFQSQNIVLARRKARPLHAIAHLNRLQNADTTAQSCLCFQTGVEKQFAEHSRRAVHDWHFRPINLNQQIIESDTCTRREKMLHGRNLAACLICQRRSELDFSDLIPAGMNVARILKIGAAKADSSIGVSRLDDHARACTGMHTNPCADYRCLQCGLILYSSQVYSPCRPAINTTVRRSLNTSIVAHCCRDLKKAKPSEVGRLHELLFRPSYWPSVAGKRGFPDPHHQTVLAWDDHPVSKRWIPDLLQHHCRQRRLRGASRTDWKIRPGCQQQV